MKNVSLFLSLLLLMLLIHTFVSSNVKADWWTPPTQLTTNTAAEWYPSISGDGSKIVFNNFVESGLENSNTEIFVINSDGTGLTQLTNNTKWNTGPTICDYGEIIAFRGCFETDEGWDDDLFVVKYLSNVEDENGDNENGLMPLAIAFAITIGVLGFTALLYYRRNRYKWST